MKLLYTALNNNKQMFWLSFQTLKKKSSSLHRKSIFTITAARLFASLCLAGRRPSKQRRRVLCRCVFPPCHMSWLRLHSFFLMWVATSIGGGLMPGARFSQEHTRGKPTHHTSRQPDTATHRPPCERHSHYCCRARQLQHGCARKRCRLLRCRIVNGIT